MKGGRYSFMEQKEEVCSDCYRIACKQCDWVASEQEVKEIQKGCMSACPKCGWKPGQS